MNWSESILGLLTGSLGTIIIKGIIDGINRKNDFNRDLKKLTYTRKIEKAETDVAFYSTYMSTLIEMKKSMEVMLTALKSEGECEIDYDIVQSLLNQNSVNLTELMKRSHYEANAIHLYFDLEDLDLWNENDISELIENIAELKSKDNEIQIWLDLHTEAENKGHDEQAQGYWSKIQELLPSYLNSFQAIIDSFEKNKIAIRNIILEIKKDFKSN